MKSGGFSERRSEGSTTFMGRNKDTMIDIGVESRITGVTELGFRENAKMMRKVPLTMVMKNQSRDIGAIEFQI
jgi:hypothetical protein